MEFDSFALAASTADLGEEPAARDHADLVEFRMDLAASPLETLADYDGTLPLLVTNRAAWEGGEADAPGRLDALRTAVEFDAVRAVDIELAVLRDDVPGVDPGPMDADPDAGADFRAHARANDASVVASVHDFAGTPGAATLTEVLSAAAAAGDVGKLSVTATDRGDALRLLTATLRATERDERVATMAMGEAGRHTRALAPVYGSRIGYAPVDPGAATAPGQYDLETLRGLVDALS